ncbi:MAG: hydrogenase maturation nickel metallochaperone HypA [Acidobacteria bacterium]|nr:hydrogenase maturation nickel metallochaperone HypA [Acidobacteriota bacterium]
MHEMGIAIEIYRTSREAVLGHGPGRIERVRVAVGELAAVEPDLLSFAWEAVVAGSADSEAALEVDWRPARQLCSTCGEVAERASGSWLRLCPRCEQPLAVEGGDELDILEIVYEAEEPAVREA